VKEQIGLAHRRDRMPAHDRVSVYAIGFAAIGGEEIAEGGITLELRRTDQQRHGPLIEDPTADLDGPPDIADRGTGIEG
jgi:hypothetical protein